MSEMKNEISEKKNSNWWIWVIVVLVGLMIISALAGFAIWRTVSRTMNNQFNSEQLRALENGSEKAQKDFNKIQKEKDTENINSGTGGISSDKKSTNVDDQLKTMDSTINSVSADDFGQDNLSDSELGI